MNVLASPPWWLAAAARYRQRHVPDGDGRCRLVVQRPDPWPAVLAEGGAAEYLILCSQMPVKFPWARCSVLRFSPKPPHNVSDRLP